MAGDRIGDLLDREAQAWRELPRDEYDRTAADLLDRAASGPGGEDRAERLTALATEILGRHAPSTVASRARAAAHLIALLGNGTERQLQVSGLVLEAWRQLCGFASRAPAKVSTVADLPRGAVYPVGTDPSAIADPALRALAVKAQARQQRESEAWNDKQRAVEQLERLVDAIGRAHAGAAEGEGSWQELIDDLAKVDGLPGPLRERLRAT
jgi:hypothetical protein